MVGCAMRTKMPAGRYLHGAHSAPYPTSYLAMTEPHYSLFTASINARFWRKAINRQRFGSYRLIVQSILKRI